MENDCLFCKIIAGEIPAHKVYEDDDFFAFLDIHPVNPGHTLIVPKAHHRNIFDLPTDILEKMGPVVQKIALAIQKTTQADGTNIISNNEPSAGQVIFHSHTHIIPRHTGDGFTHWQGKTIPTEEEFKNLAEKIKHSLH